jgi:hypothetical protein
MIDVELKADDEVDMGLSVGGEEASESYLYTVTCRQCVVAVAQQAMWSEVRRCAAYMGWQQQSLMSW